MMRWILLATLILSGNLQAADGSFTITSGNAADIAFTRVDDINPTTNNDGQTTGRLGWYNSTYQYWFLRFEAMNDSMIARSAMHDIDSWDSARIAVVVTAAVASGDSLTIAMWELRSTRVFEEVTATWNVWKLANNWSTAGAENTSSDVESAYMDTSITLVVGNSGAGTNITFKVPGANVSDTLNNAGVTFKIHRMGVNDGTTCAVVIGTDDNATATNRPKITVYYTYTPAATATRGTGRFGRSQTGEYLNVR